MMRSFPRLVWRHWPPSSSSPSLSGGWLLRPPPPLKAGSTNRPASSRGSSGPSITTTSIRWVKATCISGPPTRWWGHCTIRCRAPSRIRIASISGRWRDGDPSGAWAVGVGWEGRTGGNVIAPGDEVLSINGQNTRGWSPSGGGGPSANLRTHRHHGGQAARGALTGGRSLHPHGDPRPGRLARRAAGRRRRLHRPAAHEPGLCRRASGRDRHDGGAGHDLPGPDLRSTRAGSFARVCRWRASSSTWATRSPPPWVGPPSGPRPISPRRPAPGAICGWPCWSTAARPARPSWWPGRSRITTVP